MVVLDQHHSSLIVLRSSSNWKDQAANKPGRDGGKKGGPFLGSPLFLSYSDSCLCPLCLSQRNRPLPAYS
jgi:hypothetical protein